MLPELDWMILQSSGAGIMQSKPEEVLLYGRIRYTTAINTVLVL
jgi:hypothetical protein